jgi:glycosyltransferase involved in cell wall biosynthesis
MVRRDLSTIDASRKASSELEYILSSKKIAEEASFKVTVEEALKQKRVYQSDTVRNVTRVLFVSQDTSLLNPTTQTLDGFLNVSDLFDEVHILILRQGIPPKNPVLRIANNIWMYTASAPFWWLTPGAGVRMVEEQLLFAAGFRPDLIVARDPFESAITASRIARQFERPAQLHILDDYTTDDFVKKAPNNVWRRFIPHFTIKNFLSVRTTTSNVERMIAKKFTIPDVSVLPRFQNYEAFITAKATLDLKQKYKPFVFFILYIGKLNHESSFYRAIDAARFVLKNPRVGMVVLGDGVAKAEFQKRAKILGVEKQVVFESREIDAVPYLKSANLLIVTDTDSDSDEVTLQGAAAGVPLVMSRTQKREDIFEHGVSAYLCEETDVQAFADRINDLLNNFGLRKVFIQNAEQMILDKFHQNPQEYKEAYRTSIEQALFVKPDEQHEEKGS